MAGPPCRTSRGATAGNRLRLGGGLRACSGMGNARSFVDAHAVVGALAGREECLPGNPRRVFDPRLLRFGVAAGGLALFEDGAARLAQAPINIAQLAVALDLDAEVIEARLLAAR